MLRSGPRSTMLFRIRDTIFFFFLIYSQISSSTFFRFSLFSSSSPPQQLLDKLSNPSLRSTSFRVRRRRPREESLRLIKKIERVLFPLVAELSSDEQTRGGEEQVGHWENFIPSGYRMARRKRVARAANPISRGNLDRDEARQTWRTMRRNFQRGWWIGGV